MKDDKRNDKADSQGTSGQQKSEHTLFLGSKKALIGGIVTGSIAVVGQWTIGQVYNGYEARQLLEAVASSSLYLGGAVVTASATIIALMLTMISLSKQAEGEFDSIFYKRIQRIGTLSAVSLILGILLLLFLSIPLQESNQIPTYYFKTIYYILIVFVAGLAGLTVAVVLMLLNAMNSLIDVVRPTIDEDVEDAKEREDAKNREDNAGQ